MSELLTSAPGGAHAASALALRGTHVRLHLHSQSPGALPERILETRRSGGKRQPDVGLHEALVHTLTAGIHHPQVVLGAGGALLGGEGEPVCRPAGVRK